MIEITQENHHLSSDFKLKHFGYGEWVEEEDDVRFVYRNTQCKILRTSIDFTHSVFGGYLCGYVNIPQGHPWINLEYSDIETSVHWGLTFKTFLSNGECWVGFDCAHCSDIIPLTEFERRSHISVSYHGEDCGFCTARSYKNVDFCKGECCRLVDEMLEAENAF